MLQGTKGIAGPGPVQIKNLFPHIFSGDFHHSNTGREVGDKFLQLFLCKLARPIEGDSWQMCQVVFYVTPTPTSHHAPPNSNRPPPQGAGNLSSHWVLITLSHPTSIREYGSSNPGIWFTFTPHLLLISPSFYR